jgi:hypothetical protein
VNLLFKYEEIDIVEQVNVVSFEPGRGRDEGDEKEHEEDVVEIDLVHA